MRRPRAGEAPVRPCYNGPMPGLRSAARAAVKNLVLDHVPRVLRRGPAAPRRVAITFDDGPDEGTLECLRVLDELSCPATFFLLGEYADAHPLLVREYVKRGHQIASHGYDHQRFTKLTLPDLLDQCTRTEQALGGQATGHPWVRPPHGTLGPLSMASLIARGYTLAMWTLDSCDYDDRDAASVAARCAPDRCAAGEVLLLHEGQQWTRDALPAIVGALRRDGYECVTMQDLFAK